MSSEARKMQDNMPESGIRPSGDNELNERVRNHELEKNLDQLDPSKQEKQSSHGEMFRKDVGTYLATDRAVRAKTREIANLKDGVPKDLMDKLTGELNKLMGFKDMITEAYGDDAALFHADAESLADLQAAIDDRRAKLERFRSLPQNDTNAALVKSYEKELAMRQEKYDSYADMLYKAYESDKPRDRKISDEIRKAVEEGADEEAWMDITDDATYEDAKNVDVKDALADVARRGIGSPKEVPQQIVAEDPIERMRAELAAESSQLKGKVAPKREAAPVPSQDLAKTAGQMMTEAAGPDSQLKGKVGTPDASTLEKYNALKTERERSEMQAELAQLQSSREEQQTTVSNLARVARENYGIQDPIQAMADRSHEGFGSKAKRFFKGLFNRESARANEALKSYDRESNKLAEMDSRINELKNRLENPQAVAAAFKARAEGRDRR